VSTKTVMSIDYQATPPSRRPVASFTLHPNGRVVASYQDQGFQQTIEGDGLFLLVAGKMRTLRPVDGRLFFDSLERGLANSSRLAVVKSR